MPDLPRREEFIELSSEFAEELEKLKPPTPKSGVREIPGMLDQLREARERLKAALEERESLVHQVTVLQRQVQHFRARLNDALALTEEMENLQRENELLRAQTGRRVPLREHDDLKEKLVQSAKALKDSHFRSEASTKRMQELQREQEETLTTQAKLERRVKELTAELAQSRQHEELYACKLASIRQARDSASTQNRILAEKLVQSEIRIGDLEHEIECLHRRE